MRDAPPSKADRSRLAQEQARLVRALMSQGEPPAGFDERRLTIASRSLVNKRLREVARAWPALAQCLGERFAERFRAYAEKTPPPGEGGPLADGWAFARTVPTDDLDDEARRERFLIELHWRAMQSGLRRRRGFAVRWVRLGGKLVVGVRVPGWGVRLFGA